jgi:arylsulfatase A
MNHILTLLLALFPIASAADRRPNIILFVADDVGFETLRCYGGESYATPQIDRLAAAGMRFESCLATPMCATSRAMLLSGRHNFRNYEQWAHLDASEPTIATHLRKAGYVTGMAGKWHLGNWEPDGDGRRGPARMGFDHFLSCMIDEESTKSRNSPGAGNGYWKTVLIRDNQALGPLVEKHSEDAYLEFTRDFLRANRDRPFFFHYASLLAHRPFVKVANPGPEDFNEHGRTRNFPAMLARLDAIVGEVRTELEALGLTDNTLFLFTSDNGTDNVREAAALRSIWRGNSLRGGKYQVNELGTTVPFIACWPGKIKAAATTRTPVDFTDLLPTVLDCVGLPRPPAADGQSMLPVLLGDDNGRGRKPAFTWGTLDGSNSVYHDPVARHASILHAGRDERWRYLSDGRIFDITADPLMREPPPPGVSLEADAARARMKTALDHLLSSQPRRW